MVETLAHACLDKALVDALVAGATGIHAYVVDAGIVYVEPIGMSGRSDYGRLWIAAVEGGEGHPYGREG